MCGCNSLNIQENLIKFSRHQASDGDAVYLIVVWSFFQLLSGKMSFYVYLWHKYHYLKYVARPPSTDGKVSWLSGTGW